jgi:hypothetical protein
MDAQTKAIDTVAMIAKSISQNSEMAAEKSWRKLQLVCSGFCEQTSGFFRSLGYNFGICSKTSAVNDYKTLDTDCIKERKERRFHSNESF